VLSTELDGQKYFAFRDSSNYYHFYEYDGSSWSQNTPAGAWLNMHYLTELGGQKYFAFRDSSNTYFYEYDGSSWSQNTPAGVWGHIRYLTELGGQKYFAFLDSSNYYHFYEYDGSSWTDLTPAGTWRGISYLTELGGETYFAFQDSSFNTYVYTYSLPDLVIRKSVTPSSAAPGDTITYTLTFSNAGLGAASGVVITDSIPVSVTNTSLTSRGVPLTLQPGSRYVWNVADLAQGEGGLITITGVLSEPLAAGLFTNTATIIFPSAEQVTANNIDRQSLTVSNLPPVADDDSYTTNEDITLTTPTGTGVLNGDSDPNGSPLTAMLDSDVVTGTLELDSSGAFTYTPLLNWSGSVTFTYHAHDGSLVSNMAVVTLTVDAVNDPPTAANDAYSTGEDLTLTVSEPGLLANDSDPEEDPLTAVLDSDVATGTLDLDSSGAFTYTPLLNWSGSVTFTYHAHDGSLVSNMAVVTLTVDTASAYLPLILRNVSNQPDLIILPGSLAAATDKVSLTIQNTGSGPVTDAFWVDVYFNPDQVPTVNQPWDTIAPAGAFWGVTQPLASGESLVLTTGGPYYAGGSPTFPAGATVYAYVDSINYDTTYGNVLESEKTNNLGGPVTSTQGQAQAAAGEGQPIPASEQLPGR
jgi:uncharacterized repeat protein (TIGR01451 family)